MERLAAITGVVNPELRKREVAELLNSGTAEVTISRHLPPNLMSLRLQIVEGLLLNTWYCPARVMSNRIPGQGSSDRLIASSTLSMIRPDDSSVVPVRVVIKKVEQREMALREQRNLERIQEETNVRTIKPFAVINLPGDGAATYILTLLETGVFPLERLRFESFIPSQLKSFVAELAEFIAGLANAGVIHNDLRLRNVGYDCTQRLPLSRRRTEFLLFDLESVQFVDRDTLAAMHNRRLVPAVPQIMEYRRIADRFIGDAHDMLSELTRLLPGQDMRRMFVESFLSHLVFLNSVAITESDFHLL